MRFFAIISLPFELKLLLVDHALIKFLIMIPYRFKLIIKGHMSNKFKKKIILM